jgi:predicted MFS family arabinose efflux permease
MGALTAVVGWRAGFGLGVAAVVVLGVVVASRVDAARPERTTGRKGGAVQGRGWLVVAAMFVLMTSAQSLFVTFGPWFEDRFGFDALGAVELVASTTSARRTDHWGKERSVALGSLLIVPGALLVVAGNSTVALAVAGTAVWLLGFEFAVVSMLPMATHLAPDSPGTGLGWVLGAGALGRALAAVVATSAYERGGIAGPAALGALCAVVCAGLIAAHAARQPR